MLKPKHENTSKTQKTKKETTEHKQEKAAEEKASDKDETAQTDEHAEDGNVPDEFDEKTPVKAYVAIPAINARLEKEPDHNIVLVELSLAVPEEKLEGEIKKYLPKIRNDYLLIISSKTKKELMDIEGRKKMKIELRQSVNKVLAHNHVEGQVSEVLFTNFIIQ
jgi:flagellar FliL protein